MWGNCGIYNEQDFFLCGASPCDILCYHSNTHCVTEFTFLYKLPAIFEDVFCLLFLRLENLTAQNKLAWVQSVLGIEFNCLTLVVLNSGSKQSISVANMV